MAILGINAGAAFVTVLPDMRQFQAATAAGVTRSLAGFNNRLSSVGKNLTRYVTLPLVAAGAESVKMAATFNTTFSKITVLAGKLGVPIEEARKRVLALAAATGQDPQSLANALYFTASAGLKTAKIFPVLTAAAKAGEAQLSDAATAAQLLTSVMNAYEGTSLNASKAMDIFTAAVRVGKAEPQDLARTLGTVITVAAQMKVSFEQVTAAIATATDVGVPAARAVTGLRYVIANIQSPTQKSIDTLDTYGITVKNLQDRVQKQGLIQTLQYLAKTFDLTSVKGRAAWNAVIGGARGVVVANTLVGNTAKLALRNLDQITHSTGDFNAAVKKMDATPVVQFQKTFTALKVAAINLGTAILPVALKMANGLKAVSEAIARLSKGQLGLLVRVGLFIAAVGPLLRILSGLGKGYALLFSLGKKLIGIFTSSTAGITEQAAAAGEGATANTALTESAVTATEALTALAEAASAASVALGGEAVATRAVTVANASGLNAFGEVIAAQEANTVAAGEGAAAMGVEAAAAGALAVALDALGIGGFALLAAVIIGSAKAQAEWNKQAQVGLTRVAALGNRFAGTPQSSRVLATQTNPAGRLMTTTAEKAAAYGRVQSHVNQLQEDWFVSLTKTTAGLQAYNQIIKDSNGITVKQAEAIALTVSALKDMGVALTKSQVMMVHNLLAAGDFKDAMALLNEQFKVTPQRVYDLVNAMNRQQVGITANEQKMLSAAITTGDWAAALRILRDRLQETHTTITPLSKKVFDLRDKLYAANVQVSENDKKTLAAAIASNKWKTALNILQGLLKGHTKSLKETDKNLAAIAHSTLSANQKSKLYSQTVSREVGEIASLKQQARLAGIQLTKADRQQINAAVSARNYARAINLLNNRLKAGNASVKVNTRNLKTLENTTAGGTGRLHGLVSALEAQKKAAENSNSKTKDLTKNIGKVPTHNVIYFNTNGLTESMSQVSAYKSQLAALTSQVYTVHVQTSLTGAHGVRVVPFAEGGVVTRPTVALIGERGPEAVIPLNRSGPSRSRRGTGRSPVKLIVDGEEMSAYIEASYNPLTERRDFSND